MKESYESVGRKLRAHDPARDRELDESDSALMRARILSSIDEVPSRRSSWIKPVFATATFLLIITAGIVVMQRETLDSTTKPARAITQSGSEQATDPQLSAQDETTVRQVQYTTPGGTRVVWTLDPDFEL